MLIHAEDAVGNGMIRTAGEGGRQHIRVGRGFVGDGRNDGDGFARRVRRLLGPTKAKPHHPFQLEVIGILVGRGPGQMNLVAGAVGGQV